MRVGEHKTKKITEWKQTQHFRVGDVRLWNNNKMVSHYEPMEELLQSEIAALKPDTKKNGICVSLIYQTSVER